VYFTIQTASEERTEERVQSSCCLQSLISGMEDIFHAPDILGVIFDHIPGKASSRGRNKTCSLGSVPQWPPGGNL
jgi:hypothetical protein